MLTKSIKYLILFFILLNISASAQDCGKLQIFTNNKSSRVFLDSVFIGNGEAAVSLRKGFYELKVLHSEDIWNANYIKENIVIDTCGAIIKLNYDLNKSWRPDFLPTRIELPMNDEKTGFFKSSTFHLLLGGAAVLGAAAAYYKIQADKNYDEYLIKKEKILLDKTDRYDLYSGISFGLLQINFGYLIYKFLSE